MKLTAARLRQVLSYSQETGLFHWLKTERRVKAGDLAGSYTQGYFNVQVDGVLYRAHRLAWLYVHSDWPAKGIDHINGDGRDNRLVNLREADQSQNMANARRRAECKSGFKGVTAYRSRWVASIGRGGGRKQHIGVFDTPEAAHAAYVAEANTRHGEFARGA
jgi:hypothetical protein